jgi:hypothetical protein
MATVDYETMHFSANFDFASGALALPVAIRSISALALSELGAPLS